MTNPGRATPLGRLKGPLNGPTKVLMLTPALPIGGLERMMLNLALGLKANSNWKPTVVAYDMPLTDRPNLLSFFRDGQIPVATRVKAPGFSLKTVFSIAGKALTERTAVIHSHDLGALIYGSFAKAVLLGRVRLVHTQHTFVHLEFHKRYRHYEKFFTRFADDIAVVSEDLRATYRTLGVPEHKLHLIPNGISFVSQPPANRTEKLVSRRALISRLRRTVSPEICAALERSKKDYWILYLARVAPRKGQDHSIELWKQLDPELRKRATLLWVGPESTPGEVSRLKGLLDGAPDRDRILYLGPSHEPHAWLQSADISLSCSEFEGMPLGPLEAAGSGLPLVLSQIPGHLVLENLSFQYPLNSPKIGAEQVAKVIERIKTRSTPYYRELWENTQTLRDTFTVAAMAKSYSKLYNGGG